MADSAESKNAKLPRWTHHQPDSAFANSSTQSN
jgi:hypothetical protein